MGRSILTRLPFAAALVAGLLLVVITFAFSQHEASSAADRVMAGAGPVVTAESVAQMRADLEVAEAAADALTSEGLPLLALSVGIPSIGFVGELLSAQPDLLAALTESADAVALAENVVSNLESRLDEFESAESLPGLGLSLNDAVWGRFGLGLLLLVIGLAGLLRPVRPLAIVVLAIGGFLAIGPVALGNPSEASDTDALLDSLRPFTIEKVEAREAALETARTLFDGFREEILPAIAAEAGTSEEELSAELAAAASELSPEGLEELDAIIERFAALVEFSRAIQPDLVKADEISATASVWLLIGSGIALAVAAGAGLRWERWRTNPA